MEMFDVLMQDDDRKIFKKQVQYFDDFVIFGELFVCHRTVDNIGGAFTVSHKNTGRSIYKYGSRENLIEKAQDFIKERGEQWLDDHVSFYMQSVPKFVYLKRKKED